MMQCLLCMPGTCRCVRDEMGVDVAAGTGKRKREVVVLAVVVDVVMVVVDVVMLCGGVRRCPPM